LVEVDSRAHYDIKPIHIDLSIRKIGRLDRLSS